MDPQRIVIVEDDLNLARAIARNLEQQGYRTQTASSACELRRIYRNEGADLVLLDLNLGADDGLPLARELAETSPAAVIIMTGRDDVSDRVAGLDAGADDYVVKPFAFDELLARVRAVLRRRFPHTAGDASLNLGPVRVDAGSRQVTCEGVPAAAQLTEREAVILERLILAGGRPVQRGDLMHRSSWDPGDRSADVHIGHIRRKLGEAGIDALSILSVRGHGYRVVVRDDGHGGGANTAREADLPTLA